MGTLQIAIDDLTFHQCVKLGKFDTNRSISFVPPDGEFDLVKYRTTDDVVLPFTITPLVNETPDKIEFAVIVKGEFESKYVAIYFSKPGESTFLSQRS
jgi:AP-2 complex subunit mu-1